MRLLITGGHVTPALAVIDEIRDMYPEIDIVFVGREYNNEREDSTSFEYKEITDRHIPFVHLSAGRLTRIMSFRSIQNAFRIPLGFFQAFSVLQKEKPDVILSFGGYLALPVAIVGSMLGIRVYTHEQTIHPGLANKLIARFADRVFVSFPESQQLFPENKTIVTGNPVRKSIFAINKQDISNPSNLPVIYVTGGSLGAHAINVHIEHIIGKLVQSYIVIHQTGNVEEFGDFERLQERRSELPEELQNRYVLKTHIGSDEIGMIFSQAQLVVSRAGANTFFELIALKKPSVLIPLPWSAHNEQEKHAQLLEENGAAEIFDQQGKSSDLLEKIRTVSQSVSDYKKNYEKLSQKYITEATEKILAEIITKR